MAKDFVEYLPVISITLLVASVIAIISRGGFINRSGSQVVLETPTPVVQATAIPTASPTETSFQTPVPVVQSTIIPTLVPVPIQTIPSVQRRGGGDD